MKFNCLLTKKKEEVQLFLKKKKILKFNIVPVKIHKHVLNNIKSNVIGGPRWEPLSSWPQQ